MFFLSYVWQEIKEAKGLATIMGYVFILWFSGIFVSIKPKRVSLIDDFLMVFMDILLYWFCFLSISYSLKYVWEGNV